MTAAKGESRGCIFCAAASSSDPETTLTLHAGERVLVMLNRFPYTNGHLMVAPVAHVARLYESDPQSLGAIMRASAEAQKILSDVYRPEGFNIGMNFGEAAGAGVVDHYHVHVVPRWSGDTNFMTVTAETRMIPEELGTTWARLRPKFAELGSVFS
ncbi:MAG TPA: HIT domain-containing protein [Thermoanaerobaculia bacterium]|nr:HIT domain-containing protein [Thermoanaerobaculia bacterium]